MNGLVNNIIYSNYKYGYTRNVKNIKNALSYEGYNIKGIHRWGSIKEFLGTLPKPTLIRISKYVESI